MRIELAIVPTPNRAREILYFGYPDSWRLLDQVPYGIGNFVCPSNQTDSRLTGVVDSESFFRTLLGSRDVCQKSTAPKLVRKNSRKLL